MLALPWENSVSISHRVVSIADLLKCPAQVFGTCAAGGRGRALFRAIFSNVWEILNHGAGFRQ
jgi:hypothetical protein